jgi:hypothetical protein
MTGATIIRWQARDATVLALHGAFDGASAWALRVAMEESPGERFIVDLRHAVEAFDFAAGILAQFARHRWRDKRIAFRPGSPEHARLLAGHGLELVDSDEPLEPGLPPSDPWSPAAA